MIEVYVEIEILIEVVIEILIANLQFNKLTFATTINKFIPKSHSFSIKNSTSILFKTLCCLFLMMGNADVIFGAAEKLRYRFCSSLFASSAACAHSVIFSFYLSNFWMKIRKDPMEISLDI